MVLHVIIAVSAFAGPMGTFPDCAEDAPESCPNDLNDWHRICWIPEGSKDRVPAEEMAFGIGLGVAIRQASGRRR